MSDPNKYTVGWICALSTEYVAARAFLDEKHEPPDPEYVPHDNQNDYTLGRIGEHNVAIAVLPMGTYGIASVCGVAKDLLHTFPNIRIGLMVGIGGGAPSERNDIRLGDVVISMPSNNDHGGVLQYDFGKTIQSQSFKTTGFLNQPPIILRTAVSRLNAHYEIEGHQLKDMVDTVLKEKPRLQARYQRPTCDRLYKSHIIHPFESTEHCSRVCGDDSGSLEMRESRVEYNDDSAIHYGLIASANQLMKDALIRVKLAAEKNVLCFEMEAAGLMNHFPCLVIRGICDYSDTHKSKEWQGYAAMVAAAYAKDLLHQIIPKQVEAERKIREILDDIRTDLSVLSTKVNGIVDTQHDSEKENILSWLTPLDFSSLQNDLIGRKQEGTGEWLTETPEYQEWEATRGSILFCPGIPGAGKTMTASFVADHLQRNFRNDRDVGVGFIYCNYKKQQDLRPLDIFSCLLKQLSRKSSPMPDSVMALYKERASYHSRPSLPQILTTLRSVIRSFSKTFVIIDALDEYESSDRIRLMEDLFEIIGQADANLLATSRFVATVEAMFTKKKTLCREIQALPADIHKFIDGNLHKLPPFVLQNTALQDFIKDEIVKAASGMFLLSQLHLESLRGLRSPKAIRRAVMNLRKGVDAYDHAYHEAMERVKAQIPGSCDLAIEVLSWIVLTRRPLSVTELLHALAVEIGESELDEENLPDIDHVVSVCVGLVIVDKESEIVRLVHYTAQEYFQQFTESWFPNGHDILTRKCVTYLTFNTVCDRLYHNKKDLDEKVKCNPLLDYCSRNWGYHAHLSSIDGDELVLNFLANTSSVSVCNQAMIRRPVMLKLWTDYSFQYRQTGLHGVHLAGFFGLSKTMQQLLDNHDTCDLQDHDGRTVLSFASEAGHKEIVTELLDQKASVDLGDAHGCTPLHYAACAGRTAVVNMLLDQGASIDRRGIIRQSPLERAAEFGRIDVVRLLLDRNADVNHNSGGLHSTALSIAADRGHAAVVELLLTRGAFIDIEDRENSTPLSWACLSGHEAVVRVLLNNNADATIEDDDGCTPLSHAAAKNHFGIVNFLLDLGSDINTQSYAGNTPLMCAAEGSTNMVKLLLRRGACVDITNRHGRTALLWAAEAGNLGAVKLLLEWGADVNVQDHKGCTALSLAACEGKLDVAKALLGHGADANITEQQRATRWTRPNDEEWKPVEMLLRQYKQ